MAKCIEHDKCIGQCRRKSDCMRLIQCTLYHVLPVYPLRAGCMWQMFIRCIMNVMLATRRRIWLRTVASHVMRTAHIVHGACTHTMCSLIRYDHVRMVMHGYWYTRGPERACGCAQRGRGSALMSAYPHTLQLCRHACMPACSVRMHAAHMRASRLALVQYS